MPIPLQLPADVHGFINRVEDVEALDSLMVEPERGVETSRAAVCVISGMPGVGKTALAIHWAHRVRDRFPDGQLYINLRGYDQDAPVAPLQALGRFLEALGFGSGVQPTGAEDRSAMFRSLLAERRVLIVLDNAATARQVRPLLPGAGACRTLVTSRSLMTDLATSDGARRISLNLFPEHDAIELLCRRTEAYRAADARSDVVELANLCARLPLALRIASERAAARPHMTLSTLIHDLRDESSRWTALSASERDDADAVRTVFAWSYRALTAAEGRLFRLMSLLPGADFSSAAAAAVCGIGQPVARRLLDGLVEIHLVEQTADDRFQYHDLLRAFAIEEVRRTESAGDRRKAWRRVLSWYLHTAQNVAKLDEYAVGHAPVPLPPIEGAVEAECFSTYAEAIAWFHAERPNLTAVVGAAAESREYATTWRIAAGLRRVYEREVVLDDWLAVTMTGLKAARELGDRQGELVLLSSLAVASMRARRLDESATYANELIASSRDAGDIRNEVVARNILGLVEIQRHRMREAFDNIRKCEEVIKEHGFHELLGNPLNNSARACLVFGRPHEALDHALQGLEFHRRIQDRGGELYALMHQSRAQLAIGDTSAAGQTADHALALALESRSREREGAAQLIIAEVELARGRTERALQLFRGSVDIAREVGDSLMELEALAGAGSALRASGEPRQAEGYHRRVLAGHRSSDDSWRTAVALEDVAADLDPAGAGDEARSMREEALAIVSRYDDPAAGRLCSTIKARLSPSGT